MNPTFDVCTLFADAIADTIRLAEPKACPLSCRYVKQTFKKIENAFGQSGFRR